MGFGSDNIAPAHAKAHSDLVIKNMLIDKRSSVFGSGCKLALKRIVSLFASFLFITFSFVSVRPQIIMAGNGDPEETYKVQNADSRRDLSLDISTIGELKAYLLKSTYHMHEIMLLDVASLARSDADVYFPADLDVTILVTGPGNKPVALNGYVYADFAKTSFLRTRSALVFRPFKIEIGCRDKVLNVPNQILNSPDLGVVFENDLFQSIPDGCIDISTEQNLTLTVEIENNKVAVPKSGDPIKTATGSLKSKPLSLSILK